MRDAEVPERPARGGVQDLGNLVVIVASRSFEPQSRHGRQPYGLNSAGRAGECGDAAMTARDRARLCGGSATQRAHKKTRLWRRSEIGFAGSHQAGERDGRDHGTASRRRVPVRPNRSAFRNASEAAMSDA